MSYSVTLGHARVSFRSCQHRPDPRTARLHRRFSRRQCTTERSCDNQASGLCRWIFLPDRITRAGDRLSIERTVVRRPSLGSQKSRHSGYLDVQADILIPILTSQTPHLSPSRGDLSLSVLASLLLVPPMLLLGFLLALTAAWQVLSTPVHHAAEQPAPIVSRFAPGATYAQGWGTTQLWLDTLSVTEDFL